MAQGKHVAEPASAEEIRRSVGVTAEDWKKTLRILDDLGYLKLTKVDLIGSVADSVEGFTRIQARQALDAIFATITDTVSTGEEVKIPGFGSFTLSGRTSVGTAIPARRPTRKATAVRGATGTPERRSGRRASKGVRFTPDKELSESVNSRRRTG